jgi:holo-[acyl-carrier protein] synthase
MILGVGVDLLALPRLRAVIARRGRDRLAKRILSTSELLEWEQKQQSTSWSSQGAEQYLALR